MQVIGGRLASIAAEMSQKMIRMSFSILIKESEDIGCAITDAAGNQLAEADTSPLQMGPIPFYVRGAKRILAERGEEIRPGDVIMHNSPYHGASHSRRHRRARSRVQGQPSRGLCGDHGPSHGHWLR